MDGAVGEELRAATVAQLRAAGHALPTNLRCAERGELRCYTVPVVGGRSHYRLRIIEHESELVLAPLLADVNLPMPGATIFRRRRANESDTVAALIDTWRRLNQRAPTESPEYDQLAWMLALASAPRALSELLLINLDAHDVAITAHYKAR